MGAVAPNDEVTGAIPRNGERGTVAKPGFIMCIIGDLLSCVDAKRDDSATAARTSSEFADSRDDGRVAAGHPALTDTSGPRLACVGGQMYSGSVGR